MFSFFMKSFELGYPFPLRSSLRRGGKVQEDGVVAEDAAAKKVGIILKFSYNKSPICSPPAQV
jgi:hypothetical protein